MKLIQLGYCLGCLVLLSGTADAALTHQYTFNDGTANDSVGTANGTLMGAATVSGGQVHLTGASGTYVNLPGPTIAINTYTDATFEGWFTLLTGSGGGPFERLFNFWTENNSDLPASEPHIRLQRLMLIFLASSPLGW
jgi:hypothetical protein